MFFRSVSEIFGNYLREQFENLGGELFFEDFRLVFNVENS